MAEGMKGKGGRRKKKKEKDKRKGKVIEKFKKHRKEKWIDERKEE